MTAHRGTSRPVLSVVLAVAVVGCQPPPRNVRIGWDVPAVAPKGYRILLDEIVVSEIAPPPLDPSCSCPTVTVQVPPGQHTIKIIAFNEAGQSTPASVTIERK